MVEMRVAGIALDAASRSPIVLLRDPAGRRQVPIWIDQAQAQNILAGLGQEPPPRPLSHDLMVALIAAGGLRLDRVVIHAIEDNTFRAVLQLSAGDGDSPGRAVELDARPSDAIALAVRTDSPIWMLEEVVADASIAVDAEADAADQEHFRRFLDQVSPADLVRHLADARPEAPSGAPTETNITETDITEADSTDTADTPDNTDEPNASDSSEPGPQAPPREPG